MNLTKNVLTCQNCKTVFTAYSENLSILEVNLDGTIRTYEYCSRQCLEKQLSSVNSKNGKFDLTVVVDKIEILSERNPFKMKALLKIKEFKVDVL